MCQNTEWLRVSTKISQYEKSLISIIRPQKNLIHILTSSRDSALIPRLHVRFSDLNEYKFEHDLGFNSPMCTCNAAVESIAHFLLHCKSSSRYGEILLEKLSSIFDNDVTQLPDDHLCDLSLFGCKTYNNTIVTK